LAEGSAGRDEVEHGRDAVKMSDAPGQAGPDLHAIFGMEESVDAAEDPVVEVETTVATDEDISVEQSGALMPALDPDEVASEEAMRQPGEWTGITRPSRRGSSSRFLTDVIVDMGLASRGQVEEAIENSRGLGTTPERVLLDAGALNQDALSRALAERYGLDHLDLGAFSVDMSAANLVTTTAAKRYQAVPVTFADKRTLLVAMADPSNVLAVDDIAIMTGYEVRIAVAPPDDIATLISRLDRLEDAVTASDGQVEEEEGGAEVVDLHDTAEDAPVIKLVNRPGGRARRLRHPSRSRRARAARALPHRRGPPGRHHRGASHGLRSGLARQDHGRAEHRRASPAPGRSRRPDRRGSPRRPACRHAAERPR
jgi:hypothetical protein